MSVEEIIAKIKSRGYWRVLIRPTSFAQHRIPTLSEVRQIIQSSKVALRGWDYPFWEDREARNVGEWVESSIDWNQYIEYWRVYRSGQFIHLFAVHEDHIDVEEALPKQYPPRSPRSGFLSVVSTIFTVTEVFEFAARLSSKGILDPSASISIGLHNMNDHELSTFSASRLLFDHYVRTSKEPIIFETEVSIQDLITHTDEKALDAVTEIFENFNWNNPPRHVFAEDQRKLRERRL